MLTDITLLKNCYILKFWTKPFKMFSQKLPSAVILLSAGYGIKNVLQHT